MKIIIATSLFHSLKEFLIDGGYYILDVTPIGGTKTVIVEIVTVSTKMWVNLGIWLGKHFNANEYKII